MNSKESEIIARLLEKFKKYNYKKVKIERKEIENFVNSLINET